MWVGSCFVGDTNKTLMDVQHDMYGQTLWHLFESARRRYLSSAGLLNVTSDLTKLLRSVQSFDHRVLQSAHDKIAAYYRFVCADPGQPRLTESVEDYATRLRQEWGNFYPHEFDELIQIDDVVLAILHAVAYASTEQGFAAEKDLDALLDARYRMRMPLEAGLTK